MARREDDPRGEDREPSAPNREALYQQVAQYYRDYLGREGSPDEINGWLDSGQSIEAIWQGIRDSDEAQARAAAPAAPAPGDRAGATPPTAPAPTSSGLSAGLGGTSFTQPFPGQFTPPAPLTGPPSWWTPPPTFTPPVYKQAPAFQAPTLEEALNEPGYKFSAQEGEKALERSAAARGVLGTGGTLKDILSWGQQFAQQQYGSVWDRARQKYALDYTSQYADPYAAAFQSATTAYAPQLLGWQTQMQATQRQGENDWNRAYDLFNFDYNKWRQQREDLWSKLYQSTSI
jgi:hypothetical protein